MRIKILFDHSKGWVFPLRNISIDNKKIKRVSFNYSQVNYILQENFDEISKVSNWSAQTGIENNVCCISPCKDFYKDGTVFLKNAYCGITIEKPFLVREIYSTPDPKIYNFINSFYLDTKLIEDPLLLDIIEKFYPYPKFIDYL